MDEWKTSRGSSQIPAFGNWDYVNDLPITQYFECARQAGLIRYSSSSGECDPNSAADLYSVADYHVHNHKSRAPPIPRSKQGKGREKRGGGGNYNNKQGKVFNVTVTELPPTGKRHSVKKQYEAPPESEPPRRPPKAVDEDLYKIPPELLKRKRRLGFISRCLVPPCAV